MHPVFHVFLLDQVATEELEVATILDSRSRVEYYIQWVGMDHATWEDEDNVTTGGGRTFWMHSIIVIRYPTKPQTQQRSHHRRPHGAQP